MHSLSILVLITDENQFTISNKLILLELVQQSYHLREELQEVLSSYPEMISTMEKIYWILHK